MAQQAWSQPIHSTPISELQRGGVDAIAHASGRGAVRKYVPKMALANGALHLHTQHAVGSIHDLFDRALCDWLEETRPARPGVELATRVKQGCATRDAMVNAIRMVVPELSAEWRLRCRASTDRVLRRSQARAPSGIIERQLLVIAHRNPPHGLLP